MLLFPLPVSAANMTPMLNFAVPSRGFVGKSLKTETNADISFSNAGVQFAVLSTMNSTFGRPPTPDGALTNKSISSARSVLQHITRAAARIVWYLGCFECFIQAP